MVVQKLQTLVGKLKITLNSAAFEFLKNMLSKQPVGKVDCFGPFLLTLTDPFFKTGIYVVPSKLHNPTILCQEG